MALTDLAFWPLALLALLNFLLERSIGAFLWILLLISLKVLFQCLRPF